MAGILSAKPHAKAGVTKVCESFHLAICLLENSSTISVQYSIKSSPSLWESSHGDSPVILLHYLRTASALGSLHHGEILPEKHWHRHEREYFLQAQYQSPDVPQPLSETSFSTITKHTKRIPTPWAVFAAPLCPLERPKAE